MARDDNKDQLLEHLDQAIDLTPAELEPWLADIARTAPDLAAQIRDFLSVRDQTKFSEFMAGPGPATIVSEAGNLAGRRVGVYQLDRELGHGGMGTVWLAHRADGKFEAQVAIKFLQLAIAARSGAVRFAREGNLLARLSHPNIARLIDAGVDETGQPYLVLEYVEGEPLDLYCDRRELPVEQRIRLFLGVLAAVQHAHSKLILHRDLKPSNILVTTDGDVRLLDFGIAKLMGEGQRAQATELTQMIGRVFTPDYAAPEQVRGDDVTMATDVYALGVLLYVLLSGIHPTSRSTQSALDKLRAVIEQDATRLSVAISSTTDDDALTMARLRNTSPPQLERELAGDLDNILAKALKKNPAERYVTVNEFAEDLRRYLSHEPVLARADTVTYRTRMFVRRHRVGVTVAVAVALALVGAVVVTTWQAIEATRARALAERSARDAEERRLQAEYQAKLSWASHEFISQLFGDAMSEANDPRMRDRLSRSREMIRKRYAKEPKIHGSLLMQLAGRYAELGDDKGEADVMAEFDQLVETSRDPSLKATSDCIRAYDLIRADKLDEAAPYVASGFAEVLHNDDTDAGFECYRADAMLAASRGDREHAVSRMNEWLALLERRDLAETRNYVSSVASLAYIYTLLDDSEQSYLVTRRTRELSTRLGMDHTVGTYVDYSREAAMLVELGRLTETAELDAEFSARLRADGVEAPCKFLVEIAQRDLTIGNHAQAAGLFTKCLPEFERDGPENYARGVTLDLAFTEAMTGDLRAARAAIARFERRTTATAPPTARERLYLARAQLQIALTERKPRADLARDVRAMGGLLLPTAARRNALPIRTFLGESALAAGEIDLAREHATALRTLAEEQRMKGKTNAWLGAAELLLGECDLAEKNAASAREHFANAREQLADSVPPTHPWRAMAEQLR
jgi:serine/threonine protein kinase